MICLQSLKRGQQARIVSQALKREQAVLLLQRVGRGSSTRHRTKKMRSAIISLQCIVRKRGAVAIKRNLFAAARDVGSLKSSNEELKNEIARLKENAARAATAREVKARAEAASEAAGEAEKLKDQVRDLMTALDHERKRANDAELKAADYETKLKEYMAVDQRSSQQSNIGDESNAFALSLVPSDESNSLLAQLKEEQRKRKALQDQVERMLLRGNAHGVPISSNPVPQLLSSPPPRVRAGSSDDAFAGRRKDYYNLELRANELDQNDQSHLYPGRKGLSTSPLETSVPHDRVGSPNSLDIEGSPQKDELFKANMESLRQPPSSSYARVVTESELDEVEAELSPDPTRKELSEGSSRVSSLLRRSSKVISVYGSLDDDTQAMNFGQIWDHESGGSSEEEEEENRDGRHRANSSPGADASSPMYSPQEQREAVAATIRAATPEPRFLNDNVMKVSISTHSFMTNELYF